MQFHRITACLAFSSVFLVSQIHVLAQDSDLGARLERATALSSVMAIDEKPWHMKLDVTVFNDAGKNAMPGTIEVFKQGKLSREVFTFGDAVTTRVDDGNAIYWSTSDKLAPYRATEILDQVLHPGPTAEDLKSSKPTLIPHKFGKLTMDCIMLTQPIKGLDNVPLGLYPTFCLKPDTDTIRIGYNFGTRIVVINGLGSFLGHNIATEVDIQENDTVVAKARLIAMATYQPEPDQFVPTKNMKRADADARLSGGVVAGLKLGGNTPRYPETARQNHVSGTVVLHAIIGYDGQVHALRPVVSPDSDLTVAAIEAVRTWKYKPYLINGVPTEVDTTITVNFNLTR